MLGVWVFGLGAAVLACGLAVYLLPLEPNVVALQLTFTPRAFGDIVHDWSAGQLARFRAHLPWDCLLLALYALFGHRFVAKVASRWLRRPGLAVAAAWLLPLAALFDATENALHWWLTAAPRFGVPGAYLAAGLAASAKWALLAGFCLLLAWAAARSEALSARGQSPHGD